MKRIAKAIYQTPEEIDQIIKQRQAEANKLLPGEERQAILIEIAQLRSYADAKRWIGSLDRRTGA